MTEKHQHVLSLLEKNSVGEREKTILREIFSALADEDAATLSDALAQHPEMLVFLAQNLQQKIDLATTGGNHAAWDGLIQQEVAFLGKL